MGYGLAGIIILGTAIFLFGKGMAEEKRKKSKREIKLRESYGKLPEKFLRSDSVPAVLKSFSCRAGRKDGLDESVWRDLQLDQVFSRINYTCSGAGEAVLYDMLRRCRLSDTDAEELEETAGFFTKNAEERIKVQKIFDQIGKDRIGSVFECLDILKKEKEYSNRWEILADICYIPGILISYFSPGAGIAVLTGIVSYQIVRYFKERSRILPHIAGIAVLLRTLESAQLLAELPCNSLNARKQHIKSYQAELQFVKRHTFWILQCGKISGSPMDLLFDYMRMLFHFDIIQFNRKKKQLQAYDDKIQCILEDVGYLDAVISVVMFRASLQQYCKPVHGDRIIISQCAHPLLENPVKNDIDAGKGVLLTGSNASGKSTFLRTVAVNMVLAQSVHTVLAESYQAPVCRIYTSMEIKDDLTCQESYYMAEIRSLKRIVDVSRHGQTTACFIDEVLRGTNTVERIAASTQILKSLSHKGIFCFAATHDGELTELLAEQYDNYHFEEEVHEQDIYFPYQLKKGAATTRNAIKLLQIAGYPQETVEAAEEMAEEFVRKGIWK